MTDSLLVLNAGSWSIKFALFVINDHSVLKRVVHGQVESLDEKPHFYIEDDNNTNLHNEYYEQIPKDLNAAHAQAVTKILQWLETQLAQYKICAVGHRVVHGGDGYIQPERMNEAVIKKLERFNSLAPLHQPYNLAPINMLLKQRPKLLQVACFDTAFHQTQSSVAQAFALPKNISSIPIKRYGFHGLSYEYIASVLPNYFDKDVAKGRIIVAHLGRGASLCAIKNYQRWQ